MANKRQSWNSNPGLFSSESSSPNYYVILSKHELALHRKNIAPALAITEITGLSERRNWATEVHLFIWPHNSVWVTGWWNASRVLDVAITLISVYCWSAQCYKVMCILIMRIMMTSIVILNDYAVLWPIELLLQEKVTVSGMTPVACGEDFAWHRSLSWHNS